MKTYLAAVDLQKLKMFGWGYVTNLCIALFRKEEQEKAVIMYYGECLRTITENTAKYAGGSYIKAKIKDIFEPQKIENRTPEEIINGIKGKLEKMRE